MTCSHTYTKHDPCQNRLSQCEDVPCIARADADDTMPGNISGGRPLFTLVEITAANCVIASKEAKRQATEKLGMKPKHLKVRCVGK